MLQTSSSVVPLPKYDPPYGIAPVNGINDSMYMYSLIKNIHFVQICTNAFQGNYYVRCIRVSNRFQYIIRLHVDNMTATFTGMYAE